LVCTCNYYYLKRYLILNNYNIQFFSYGTINFKIFILILLNRDEDDEKPSSFETELASMDFTDDDFLDETVLIGEVCLHHILVNIKLILNKYMLFISYYLLFVAIYMDLLIISFM